MSMFGNLGQFADLIKNAGKIRESIEKAHESLGQVIVEGSAGGGQVVAKATGRLELVGVRIDPKLIASGDVELVEELVTAAVNQAMAKAREAAAQSIQGITGGLPIPGNFPNVFGFGDGRGGQP